MKLRVVHRTGYQYSDPVTTSLHEARLAPRESETQRTLSHALSITPFPSVTRKRFDYFGNRVQHFGLSEPHRSLEVLATSVVELRAPRALDLTRTPSWEQVRARLSSDRTRDILDAYAMTFESVHVKLSPQIAGYAASSFAQARPILDSTYDLVRRIFSDFTYDSRATEVSTPLEEVLQKRRGVCQDFAHLAIACMRAQGLAARYVSGYLLTRPPPGKVKLVGADASHAWFSAFVPEHGWVDFDPTNGVLPADEHVSIAYGRDFADVTPLRGVILGGGQHELTVNVEVDVP